MNRSVVRTATSILALFILPPAWAQQNVLDNPEFVAAREMIRVSQEEIIREDLRLTAEEAAAFWPLYEKYSADTLPVRDRYITLIADYMRQYASGILTDEYAARMIDGYFAIREDMLRIRKGYIPQFAAIMPMLKVARFYQLENKMTADVEAELALLVPLVETE